jgi:hypothetical protein
VNLVDDVTAALPALRAEADALMLDECVIFSRTPGTVFNEETGHYESVEATVYEGRCRFRAGTVSAQEIDVQGQQRIEQEATLSIPIAAAGSGDVDRDQVARITKCVWDPALVGVEMRIITPHRQSLGSARRFRVEETR